MVHFAGLSGKETSVPVYTTVKIESSLRETKKVLTFLEVLQHISRSGIITNWGLGGHRVVKYYITW